MRCIPRYFLSYLTFYNASKTEINLKKKTIENKERKCENNLKHFCTFLSDAAKYLLAYHTPSVACWLAFLLFFRIFLLVMLFTQPFLIALHCCCFCSRTVAIRV